MSGCRPGGTLRQDSSTVALSNTRNRVSRSTRKSANRHEAEAYTRTLGSYRPSSPCNLSWHRSHNGCSSFGSTNSTRRTSSINSNHWTPLIWWTSKRTSRPFAVDCLTPHSEQQYPVRFNAAERSRDCSQRRRRADRILLEGVCGRRFPMIHLKMGFRQSLPARAGRRCTQAPQELAVA